jgi:hypothetical protein
VWHPREAPLSPVWEDAIPRVKHCRACGTPLTAQTPARLAASPPSPLRYPPGYLAEKILTSKAALEGERKQVTVLSDDMKGSMELPPARNPKEARELLLMGSKIVLPYSCGPVRRPHCNPPWAMSISSRPFMHFAHCEAR